jgi:hypothetical protein
MIGYIKYFGSFTSFAEEIQEKYLLLTIVSRGTMKNLYQGTNACLHRCKIVKRKNNQRRKPIENP